MRLFLLVLVLSSIFFGCSFVSPFQRSECCWVCGEGKVENPRIMECPKCKRFFCPECCVTIKASAKNKTSKTWHCPICLKKLLEIEIGTIKEKERSLNYRITKYDV